MNKQSTITMCQVVDSARVIRIFFSFTNNFSTYPCPHSRGLLQVLQHSHAQRFSLEFRSLRSRSFDNVLFPQRDQRSFQYFYEQLILIKFLNKSQTTDLTGRIF